MLRKLFKKSNYEEQKDVEILKIEPSIVKRVKLNNYTANVIYYLADYIEKNENLQITGNIIKNKKFLKEWDCEYWNFIIFEQVKNSLNKFYIVLRQGPPCRDVPNNWCIPLLEYAYGDLDNREISGDPKKILVECKMMIDEIGEMEKMPERIVRDRNVSKSYHSSEDYYDYLYELCI